MPKFQSSPSMQRETKREQFNHLTLRFQSSPSMQRETVVNLLSLYNTAISILSLYAEGDGREKIETDKILGFQSSPSMQRETLSYKYNYNYYLYFNPLPLCRGRQMMIEPPSTTELISILSLYAEGDRRTVKYGI